MNGLSVPMEGCIEDGKIDGCIDGQNEQLMDG